MKGFDLKGMLLLAGLFVAGSVNAATLYSAPTTINGSDSLVCSLVNASTSATPKTVRVDVISTSGFSISTTGDVSLGAGATAQASSAINLFTPSYCQFTVSGSKRIYRAQGCVVHPGSSCDATMIAQ